MTMKVTSGNSQNQVSKAPEKLSSDDIAAKVAAKFGKEAQVKKAAPKPDPDTKVELNTQEAVAHSDIGNNDPNSELTKEKLRGLLKAGGFDFNDKERKALSQILK